MKQTIKKNIFIAVLAGGRGERLRPKTRCHLPKQNLKLFGKRTIIQDTLKRARKINPESIFIIACKENFQHIKKQFKTYANESIVVEPFGRNTAPAIGLATLLAFRKNEESSLITMPSDHLIGDNEVFFQTMKTEITEANKENAVLTVGINPTFAESGYGYIGIDTAFQKISPKRSYKIIKFIEKPDPAKAKRLISDGSFFWNSGIFIFKTSLMLSMLKRHIPSLYRGLMALPDIRYKSRFDTKLKKLYKNLKSESLDYAVLEKDRNIRVVPSNFVWNDIGSFNSIRRLLKRDSSGNIIFGSHMGIDTKNCVIFSDTNRLVGTIGIKDVIIVVTPDAVLVCDNKRAEDVKKLVGRLKKRKKFLKFL